MKLAEALQLRADLNRKIEQLNQRLSNNALVQEGENPAENPYELLDELDSCIQQLQEMISRINLTNCQTVLNGRSLTELIAEKDCLSIKISRYRDLIYKASQATHRATRNEIKILSAVNVRELQKKLDGMSKSFRQLDNQLQEMNWKTELL